MFVFFTALIYSLRDICDVLYVLSTGLKIFVKVKGTIVSVFVHETLSRLHSR